MTFVLVPTCSAGIVVSNPADVFKLPEPYNQPGDKVENLSRSNRNAVIRHCQFDSCGNFLRIPKLGARIEFNEFRNIAETPIMGNVSAGMWLDWPRPLGITIRKNTFTNCQWTRQFHDQTCHPNWAQNGLFRSGLIQIDVNVHDWQPATAQVVRDIEIVENTIEGWGQSAIKIAGASVENTAENLIHGNVLEERAFVHAKVFPRGRVPVFIFDLHNSHDTKIVGNGVNLLLNTSVDAVLHVAQDCGSSVEFDFDLARVRDER